MTTPPSAAALLRDAIAARTACVAILGLGYAGLPLAEAFHQAGFAIVGYDTDPSRVARLLRGESYLRHFGRDRVQKLAAERFTPTTDPAVLANAAIGILCVPTPLDEAREPDLSAVIAAAEALAAHPRPGRLVVLESTTYPGTTRDVVRPILERGGLRTGHDLFLAFSPEREDPGNAAHATTTIPRVVGGLDPVSGQLAVELFATACRQVVPVSNAEIAEAAKILENTYRAVNIALVNELKMLYDRMGIDIWEVIEAAKTKPFGYQPFYPGPGWGGHCIPIDPFYLAWVGRQVGVPARFVELAGAINTAMPEYVLGRLRQALAARGRTLAGCRVAVLGVAYKRDVEDCRESPGLELLALLQQADARISYHDPHVPCLPPNRHGLTLECQPLTADWLAGLDAVLIAADHSDYDWEWIAAHAPLIVDTRNATRSVATHRERIVRA
jgi:UDP-N-acetyl-D-glucosamine dehydrogenase